MNPDDFMKYAFAGIGVFLFICIFVIPVYADLASISNTNELYDFKFTRNDFEITTKLDSISVNGTFIWAPIEYTIDTTSTVSNDKDKFYSLKYGYMEITKEPKGIKEKIIINTSLPEPFGVSIDKIFLEYNIDYNDSLRILYPVEYRSNVTYEEWDGKSRITATKLKFFYNKEYAFRLAPPVAYNGSTYTVYDDMDEEKYTLDYMVMGEYELFSDGSQVKVRMLFDYADIKDLGSKFTIDPSIDYRVDIGASCGTGYANRCVGGNVVRIGRNSTGHFVSYIWRYVSTTNSKGSIVISDEPHLYTGSETTIQLVGTGGIIDTTHGGHGGISIIDDYIFFGWHDYTADQLVKFAKCDMSTGCDATADWTNATGDAGTYDTICSAGGADNTFESIWVNSGSDITIVCKNATGVDNTYTNHWSGSSWVQKQVVDKTDECKQASFMENATGAWFITVREYGAVNDAIRLAISTDDGTTWKDKDGGAVTSCTDMTAMTTSTGRKNNHEHVMMPNGDFIGEIRDTTSNNMDYVFYDASANTVAETVSINTTNSYDGSSGRDLSGMMYLMKSHSEIGFYNTSDGSTLSTFTTTQTDLNTRSINLEKFPVAVNDSILGYIYGEEDTDNVYWSYLDVIPAPVVNKAPEYLANFSDYSPTFLPENYTLFNVTWDDDIDNTAYDTAILELNLTGANPDTNITMTRISGTNISSHQIILSAGGYQWRAYANDSSDLWNLTETVYFTIAKNTTAKLTLTANGNSDNSTEVVYPSAITAVGSETNDGDAGCTYTLYRDGVNADSENNVAMELPVENYTYLYELAGCQNWTDSSEAEQANVTKGDPLSLMMMTIQGVADNSTILTYPETSTTIAWENNPGDSDVTYGLYRNISTTEFLDVLSAENNTAITLGAGVHAYLFNSTANENWTKGAMALRLKVDPAVSALFLTINGNSDDSTDITTQDTITAIGWENNGEDSDCSYNLYRDATDSSSSTEVNAENNTAVSASSLTGNWTYKFNTTGCTNYTVEEVTELVNVTLSQLVGSASVTTSSTEYRTGEEVRMMVQVLDDSGDPINNANPILNATYPNETYFISGGTMSYIASSFGVYNYSYVILSTDPTGSYMFNVNISSGGDNVYLSGEWHHNPALNDITDILSNQTTLYDAILNVNETLDCDGTNDGQICTDISNLATDIANVKTDTEALIEDLDCDDVSDTPICDLAEQANASASEANITLYDHNGTVHTQLGTIEGYVDMAETYLDAINASVNCTDMGSNHICDRLNTIQGYTDQVEGYVDQIEGYVDTLESGQLAIFGNHTSFFENFTTIYTDTQLIIGYTDQLEGYTDTLESGQTTISGYTDTLEVGQVRILANMSTMNDTINTINANTDEAESKLDEVIAYVDTLESGQTTIQGYTDSVEATLSTISGYTDSLEAGQTTLNNYVDTLELGQTYILNNVTDLRGYLNCTTSPSSSVCDKLDDLIAYTDTLEAGQSTIQGYTDTVEGTLILVEGNLTEIDTSLDNIGANLTNTNSTILSIVSSRLIFSFIT